MSYRVLELESSEYWRNENGGCLSSVSLSSDV
mgnify:CR=1 FL=1